MGSIYTTLHNTQYLKNTTQYSVSTQHYTMTDSTVGIILLVTNSILCLVSIILITTNPTMSVVSAIAATVSVTVMKSRCPVSLLWPVTALAVIAQTMASSSVMSVPATVVVSPIVALIQGFLALPM